MKYINTRSKVSQVAIKAEFNSKFNTYLLTLEEGNPVTVSASTFKRWWKQLPEAPEVVETLPAFTEEEMKEAGIHVLSDDEALEHAVVDPDESVDTEAELTDEQYAEIGKEIAEQAKHKARVKKMATKKPGKTVNEALDIIKEVTKELGFVIQLYVNSPKQLSIKTSAISKDSYSVYIGKTKLALGMAASKVPEGFTADRVRNCPCSHAFDIAYDDMDKLINILKAIKTKEEK